MFSNIFSVSIYRYVRHVNCPPPTPHLMLALCVASETSAARKLPNWAHTIILSGLFLKVYSTGRFRELRSFSLLFLFMTVWFFHSLHFTSHLCHYHFFHTITIREAFLAKNLVKVGIVPLALPSLPQKVEMLTQYGQNFGPPPPLPFLKVGQILFTGFKLEQFQL